MWWPSPCHGVAEHPPAHSWLAPDQAVGLKGERQAGVQASQFGMWSISFQGPAVKAPRDVTEDPGVSVGKEDGVTPLGEQPTPPHMLPARGGLLSSAIHLFSECPKCCFCCVPGPGS